MQGNSDDVETRNTNATPFSFSSLSSPSSLKSHVHGSPVYLPLGQSRPAISNCALGLRKSNVSFSLRTRQPVHISTKSNPRFSIISFAVTYLHSCGHSDFCLHNFKLNPSSISSHLKYIMRLLLDLSLLEDGCEPRLAPVSSAGIGLTLNRKTHSIDLSLRYCILDILWCH